MPKPNVREKVVIAGLQEFHRLGFNGCSVEDITSLAGVPKGSFYNHFKSKEDLALEAIERFREAGLHKSLGESNRSPVKRLKRILRVSLQSLYRFWEQQRLFVWKPGE